MNTEQPTEARSGTTLPELTDERIDEIENALFADIARERAARRARRSRWMMAGGAAAAVVVIAAAVLPPVVSSFMAPQGAGDSAFVGTQSSPEIGGGAVAPDMGEADGGIVDLAPGGDDASSAGGDATEEGASTREIITTATATVVVDDPEEAAQAIGAAAEARGGYVESMRIGKTGVTGPADGSGAEYDVIVPYPTPIDGAWITVRVPADQLTALTSDLSEFGDVTASAIQREDVTEQAVDLRARIDATQASVDRLTELMSQAGSLSDLIEAERALSERQAMLESYRQQLESLEGQVQMSTLTVTLTTEPEPVEANPAGFGDGLAAGWNGLVATVNGIVIGLGFLIPWIAVAGVVGLVVWGIVALARGRRHRVRTDALAERPKDDASAR